MSIESTYTAARANFAALCDHVTQARDVVIIRRRDHEDVALVAADELECLMETAHLMRSPRNAERLLSALTRAREGGGEPMSVATLGRKAGLE